MAAVAKAAVIGAAVAPALAGRLVVVAVMRVTSGVWRVTWLPSPRRCSRCGQMP